MTSALRTAKLITGRQLIHLMRASLRLNDSMPMVYSITDIAALTWTGDTLEQVSLFKADWEHVLDNMDPNVDIGEEALKHILYEQMKESNIFDSEVKHYLRTPTDRSYQFLRRALDCYLALDRIEESYDTALEAGA